MKKKNLLIGKKPKIESKSVGLMKKCSDQFDLNSFFRTIMILKVVWKSFNKAINWEFEIQTLFKTIMKIGTHKKKCFLPEREEVIVLLVFL